MTDSDIPAKQRLDFRAIDQQSEKLYGPGSGSETFLRHARDILLSLLTQYGSNLHPDDDRALRVAIEALDYLLIPPTVEVVSTNKGPFVLSPRSNDE